MSRSKSQRKNDRWTFEVLRELVDLYKVEYEHSYRLGSLFARAEDKALRKYKSGDMYPGYIQKAAMTELALRKAERRAERNGTFRIS